MSAPSVPSLVRVGRENVQLKWSSKYVPPAVDRTKFGFRVMICRTEDDSVCVVSVLVRGHDALVELEPGTFTASIASLSPFTEYRYRYGNFEMHVQS